ncbi:hypothetical protein KAR91_84900 [Candidatus Pacearchaeota archaeon]|nr:hypothetical protein [Candidatus Pacearchaeota archaeon]
MTTKLDSTTLQGLSRDQIVDFINDKSAYDCEGYQVVAQYVVLSASDLDDYDIDHVLRDHIDTIYEFGAEFDVQEALPEALRLVELKTA